MYFYHTFAGINFKLTQVNITAMIIEDGLVETKYKSGLFFENKISSVCPQPSEWHVSNEIFEDRWSPRADVHKLPYPALAHVDTPMTSRFGYNEIGCFFLAKEVAGIT